MMEELRDENIRYVNLERRDDNYLSRKIEAIKDVVTDGLVESIESPETYIIVLGAGVAQSLITQKGFMSGFKMGLGVYAACVGAQIIYNVVSNRDYIKEF